VIRFAMPQDFTRIYTFVTSEYSQGQRDYISLVNERGGVGGYTIVADVSDHANDLPRAIEAYERAKREWRPAGRSRCRRRWRAPWCRVRWKTRST
jgi:branched-chain amino acid transport system substrate-binding protein